MRQMIRVADFARQHNEGFPSTNATEYVAWFQKKLSRIPKQYRDTAKIEIDSDDSNACVVITTSYERPETDEEMAWREAKKLQRSKIWGK